MCRNTEKRLVIQQKAGDKTRYHPCLLNFQSPNTIDKFYLLNYILYGGFLNCALHPQFQVGHLGSRGLSHPALCIYHSAYYIVYSFSLPGPYSHHSRRTENHSQLCDKILFSALWFLNNLFTGHTWTWKKWQFSNASCFHWGCKYFSSNDFWKLVPTYGKSLQK